MTNNHFFMTNKPEELMESVGLVQPRLPVSCEVKDVTVAIVNAGPLLLDVLHVELLAADQRIGLEGNTKWRYLMIKLKDI